MASNESTALHKGPIFKAFDGNLFQYQLKSFLLQLYDLNYVDLELPSLFLEVNFPHDLAPGRSKILFVFFPAYPTACKTIILLPPTAVSAPYKGFLISPSFICHCAESTGLAFVYIHIELLFVVHPCGLLWESFFTAGKFSVS